MLHWGSRLSECNICKREYTSTHFEVRPGFAVYVCQDCLEYSEDNFVWICLNCGASYRRPKEAVINRMNGNRPKNTTLLLKSRIIQGLNECVACNPRMIWESMKKNKEKKEATVHICC